MSPVVLDWLLLCVCIATVYAGMSAVLCWLQWLFRKVHGVRDGLE